jgi:fumarate hydratase class I
MMAGALKQRVSRGGPSAETARNVDLARGSTIDPHPPACTRTASIWRIEVENFPAFIVIDDKGNDFFKELNLG